MSDPFIRVASQAFKAGWYEHAAEIARQKADPEYVPIMRDPFEARLELERSLMADPEPPISETGER